MTKKRPAIIVRTFGAYSESFIQAHIQLLSDSPIVVAVRERSNEIIFNGQPFNQNSLYTQILYVFCKLFKLTKLDTRRFYVLRALKQLNCKIIIAEYGELGLYIRSIAKESGIPLIVFFRGYDVYKNDPFKFKLEEYKRLFSESKRVIAVSKDIQDILINKGCDPQKVEWLPSGADSSFFELSPTHKEQKFLFIGRFVNKKAPYQLIFAFNEVVKNYPNAKLLLGGNGELIQSSIALVKYFNLEGKVEFLGPISKEKFSMLLQTSLCFVQHSVTALDGDSEGTPNSIMEAAAAGLPVISTKHGGIKDVVIDGETGFLVEENDWQMMSHYMIVFLENRDQAINMGKRGRNLIKKHFSREKQINRLLEIIQE